MEEISGRTLLDEGSIIDIPVIVQAGLVCVPGICLHFYVAFLFASLTTTNFSRPNFTCKCDSSSYYINAEKNYWRKPNIWHFIFQVLTIIH